MDKSEYWILHAAVESGWPLFIVARENHGEIMNIKDLGMTFDQLHEVFLKLFEAGYLIASRWVHFEPTKKDMDQLFVPTADELERGLRERLDEIYYELTAQGGAAWEAVTKPDWEQYVNKYAISGPGEEYSEYLASCNRALLEEYLSKLQRWPSTKHVSYHMEEKRPFHATYWKQFPVGYLLTLEELEVDDSEPDQQRELEYWAWFHRVRTWYTNPFA